MEWKDIQAFHKNPPSIQLHRKNDVQQAYEKYKVDENELKKRLFSKDQVWVITKNKFPYHFIDSTKHYVIWFRNRINYKLIDFLLRDYDNVVYFENKHENKSIKGILHVHIFINDA